MIVAGSSWNAVLSKVIRTTNTMTMNVTVTKTKKIAAKPNQKVHAAKLVTVTKTKTGRVTRAAARMRVEVGHGKKRVGTNHVTRVGEVVEEEGEII